MTATPTHRRSFWTPAILALAILGIPACDPGADSPDAVDGAPPATAADTMPTGDTAAADTAALLNPNEAGEEELRELGLDSAVVAIILDGRPFETMVPVDQALSAHMDSTALDQLYRRMFIPLDLNSASREEILLVPGVGPRMAHEFEEYRPYRGIQQFRAEIGKYVDEDEVARLERYVTIR